MAAAVATLVAGELERQGLAGGAELRALVFLTIAVTVGLAGLTALPLASLLRLRLPARDRVAILGAEGLGLTLGEVLKDHGMQVVFIDSDPRRCQEAEKEGFTVIFGDGLQERILLRAQIELVGTAIGATSNEHLNSLFVSQAREWFQVPKSLVAVEAMEKQQVPEHIKRHLGTVLFEGPHDMERWAVRKRHGNPTVEQFVYEPSAALPAASADKNNAPATGETPISFYRPGERYVILTIHRNGSVSPMTVPHAPKQGDMATVALHTPERDRALTVLSELGWQPVPQNAGNASGSYSAQQ